MPLTVKRNDGAMEYSPLSTLIAQFNKLQADVVALIANFNAHTHRYDPTQTAARNTSKPQSDAQTDLPVTPLVNPAATADTLIPG